MVQKHPIDLALLAETYNIERLGICKHLNDWLIGEYELNDFKKIKRIDSNTYRLILLT